jgi:hypothetical protein
VSKSEKAWGWKASVKETSLLWLPGGQAKVEAFHWVPVFVRASCLTCDRSLGANLLSPISSRTDFVSAQLLLPFLTSRLSGSNSVF